MAEKVKRYLLENEPVETFEIIGICSAQNDFRLAWHLNTRFNLFLEKSNVLVEVPIKKTTEFNRFNYYFYHDPQNLISYFLIRNKQEGRIFMSEKTSIDYFLIMQENYILDPQDMIDELRKMDSIIAAFAFSSDEFHLSEYLIFEK